MVDESDVRRPWVLVVLLALLLAVVVATAAILVHDRRGAAGIEAVRPADIGSRGWTDDSAGRAVVAARLAATTYFSLDYRTLDADMDAMRDLGTPDFVDDYDERAQALATRMTEDRRVFTPRLPRDGTATEYLVTDRAEVLVAVDVSSASDVGPGRESFRTRVSLVLVDGDWLVSAIDEVE